MDVYADLQECLYIVYVKSIQALSNTVRDDNLK